MSESNGGPFCKKHPTVLLKIGTGKNKNNYVYCPECKSAKGTVPAPAPANAAGEKKNGNTGSESKQSWWDKPVL